MHKQILFAKIGWGEVYQGEDITGKFREPSASGDWAECFNFMLGPRESCYGYIPPIGRHHSPPKPDRKDGWLVVFCSRRTPDEPLRPVGWYEKATFQNGYEDRPPNRLLSRSKQGPWNDLVYNVTTKTINTYLIPVGNRRLFPELPTDRFRRSYIYAAGNGKDVELAGIAERIVRSKKSAIRVDRAGVGTKLNERERRRLLRKLFDQEVDEIQESEDISPEEARNRATASILQRPGQVHFRKSLLSAYGGVCAISDCDCPDALEAAHIERYADGGKDQITNGLLLRADLHKLFDQRKIVIDPANGTVVVSRELKKTVYQSFHGKRLKPPANLAHKPKLPPVSG
jgi:predicted restriction endonuclease